MAKGIDNAFNHMELCLVLQAVKLFLRENWLLHPRNYFDNRISRQQPFATDLFNR